MKDLIKFSDELRELIAENKQLKQSVKRTEEFLKLAICLNGNLNYRTIENADKNSYNYFINNTIISYAGNSTGGMQLIWRNPVQIEFNGKTVEAMSMVKKEEIEGIFNGKTKFY